MKEIFLVTLFFVFAQCDLDESNFNSKTVDKDLIEESIDAVDKREYLDVRPISQSDSSWIYEINNIYYEVESKTRIGLRKGPDFTVYTFILKGDDTIGVYYGWYPKAPHLFPFAFKNQSGYEEMKNSFINAAIQNNNYYSGVSFEQVNYIQITNKFAIPIRDSMKMELYTRENTNIWISKPLANRTGRTDVIVEFKEDSIDYKIHFFARTQSNLESEKIINLAKQIK